MKIEVLGGGCRSCEKLEAATRDALVSQRAGQLVASLVAERRKELEVSFDPQLLATFELNTAGPEAG